MIVDLIKINPLLLQVNECGKISCRISEIISVHGENDQKISSYPIIPNDFFEDMELLWKGRVKRIHLEEAYAEVEKAADALSLAVSLFSSQIIIPILSPRIIILIITSCASGSLVLFWIAKI